MTRTQTLPDLTHSDTIYTIKSINAIQIRLKPEYLPAADEPLAIHNAAAAYEVLKGIYATLDQEHFIMLALNCVNEVRCYKVVTSGGQYFLSTDLCLIFRTALLLGAAGLVGHHNHPSEQLVPSDKDLMITETLVVAGQILNIEVCDHIIIYGEKDYTD